MRLDVKGSDFFSGIPVTVDPERIDRELTRLWKPDRAESAAGLEPGEGMEMEVEAPSITRASLSNLVFYLPDEAACERARKLLPEVGRRFPSRMILLTKRGWTAGEGALAATIAAVCHVSSPGSPPVCCEQITLEARDGSLDVFRGAVAPLLVPDLPVILVLPCPEGEPLIELLRGIADRVVFDSRGAPLSALKLVSGLLEKRAKGGVDDLAWRDTVGWRRALCDFFDHGEARPMLGSLRRIEVEYQRKNSGPGDLTVGAARAALLVGWLASRLGWKLSRTGASMVDFSATFSKNRRKLAAFLRPVEKAGFETGQILTVHLVSGERAKTYLTVMRGEKPNMLRLDYHTPEACVVPRRTPFRQESDAELLGGALERLTHQGVLAGAFQVASRLESPPPA